MAQSRKLQVFVSSTYTDLREERQAAVEAILSSGHIPAGMELFTAGDESQMSVIRRWIDESDVFLLILGGRYGSLEPNTGKSYTHLEYEYAVTQGKPLFAVVIDDEALEKRVRKAGRKILEIENARQFKQFREVVLSRMVRFWIDHRDIKLAIHETMGEFARRTDLSGWIPGDQAISPQELARLTNENAELRRQLADVPNSVVTYNGLRFDEIIRLLTDVVVDLIPFEESNKQWLREIADELGPEANLLEILWILRNDIMDGMALRWRDPHSDPLALLESFGVLVSEDIDSEDDLVRFRPSAEGRKFMLRLLAERTGIF